MDVVGYTGANNLRPCVLRVFDPLPNRAAGYLPIHLPGDPLAAGGRGGELPILHGHGAAQDGHYRSTLDLKVIPNAVVADVEVVHGQSQMWKSFVA